MIYLIVFSAFIIGAIGHEFDMARNFRKDGDCHAWFFKISK